MDFYVSKVVWLLELVGGKLEKVEVKRKPLSPEQRVEEVYRLNLIGSKKETLVLEYENNKLRRLGLSNSGYSRHVAMDSMDYGYDVLLLREDGEEIYIGVK